MPNFQNSAKIYIEHGFTVIPLGLKKKSPYKDFKWKKQSATLETLKDFPSDCNIGLILGKRSKGLIDLDFDIPEAGIIANKLFADLPGFGRKSAPFGHKMAICSDPGKTKQFCLTQQQASLIGLEKTTVLEFRSNGAQTMVPPSTHPSGEQIKWHSDMPNKLPEIERSELIRQCSICAVLAVILKMYPEQSGSRDEICLAIAGALLHAGLSPEETDELIVYIAEQKNDEESDKRRKAIASKERLEAGDKVCGLPKLCELLGITELEKKLSKWLYGSSTKPVIEAEQKIAEMNETFFVVGNEGAKCRVAFFEKHYFFRGQHKQVLIFQSFQDFRNRFMNQHITTGFTNSGKPITKPLGNFWLEHPSRRQYDKIEFAPGRETPPSVFNLWRGFAFEPVEGSWDCMKEHVLRILANGNEEAYEYIIKWAAWSVQNLSDPAEVALVFRGGKGTGKGTFCRALTLLFGDHGLQVSSSTSITGTFNAHLRDCILLFADEAVAPNDKNAESILKGLITEESIAIEGKGRDIIQARNQLHIVMASNDRWVVPASADERRFAVFDISDDMAGREDWFAPLNQEMENGGLQAMLHFFLNLELGDWHPRKNIPNNQALNDQRTESLKGLEKLWLDYLSTGEADGDPKDGRVAIPTKFFAAKTKTSLKAAGEFLKKMGCTHYRTSRPTTWVTPSLEEARKVWDREQFPVPWDDLKEWLPVPIPPDDIPF